MRAVIEHFYDCAVYIMLGALLVFLFQGIVTQTGTERKKWGKRMILIAQYVTVQMLLRSSLIEQCLHRYNQNTASIIMVLISIIVTMAVALGLYRTDMSVVLYLITTFYTLVELIRFIVMPLVSYGLTGIINRMVSRLEQEDTLGVENYMRIFENLQIAYNFILDISLLLFLYGLLRWMKNKFGSLLKNISRTELVFLTVPDMIGLGIGILLRMSIYYANQEIIFSLLDSYRVTHVLIPLLSVFCIASIFLSIFTLEKIRTNSESAMQAEIYRNQAEDMAAYMKDISHLYDGIRGMRHDMKNYISDMDALIKHSEGNQNQSLSLYLNSLCQSVAELDMKCNTGNPVSDVVITRWIREAEANRIPLRCEFIYPNEMGIDEFDISIILNNALENAIEASKQEPQGAEIRIESYVKENMFFIEISNHCTGAVIPDAEGKYLISTKPEQAQHGLGMKNIVRCSEKYFGKAEWSVAEDWFRLLVMLQERADTSKPASQN